MSVGMDTNYLLPTIAAMTGLSQEQLSTRLARADRIAQAIKEHGLGFTDAANFVDDQDELAREEAIAETHESARARELRQIEEDQADAAVLHGSTYRRNWDECGPAGSCGGPGY